MIVCQLGVALKKLKQYQDVLQLSEECIQKFPNVFQFYKLKAQALQKINTYDDANEILEIYNQYLKINPNNTECYLKKAKYSYDRRYFIDNFKDLMIDCLDKSFQLEPNNYQFCKKIIDSLWANDQFVERQKYYDKFIKLNPNSFQVYMDKANDLRKTLKLYEGIDCLRKCIEMNPDVHIDYRSLDYILQLTMYRDHADMYIRQYVQRHPYDKQAWLDYATYINNRSSDYIKYQQQQNQESHIEEAIRANNQCIQLNPKNFEGYKGIAITLILQGKDLEAQKIFKENLKFYPDIDNAPNQKHFVELLIKVKLFYEASKIIEKLYKNNPYDSETIFYKTEVLMGLKNYQQAIIYYRIYYSDFSVSILKDIYQML